MLHSLDMFLSLYVINKALGTYQTYNWTSHPIAKWTKKVLANSHSFKCFSHNMLQDEAMATCQT